MTEADSETVTAEESTCAAVSFPGSGFMEAFVHRYSLTILETLLCDRTTGCNIIWADNEYEALGDGYMGDDEITVEKITGPNVHIIKPRIAKAAEQQSLRTKSRAEVFSPAWLCNQMNNDLDAVWFGHRAVFNEEHERSWSTNLEELKFPKKKGHGWHAYIEATWLEISCGEGPFVCSRYDSVTGHSIPVADRIGFLDRKLRVVAEKTKSREGWMKWAFRALRACYGFEYQGDNLLIARINAFETFCEHHMDCWGARPTEAEMDEAAEIVSWNFWQMDGFNDAVPTAKMGIAVHSPLFAPTDSQSDITERPENDFVQPALFDLSPIEVEEEEQKEEEELTKSVPLCVLYDWIGDEPFEFIALKGKACPMEKKFYAVIGNPPYQEQVQGDNKNSAAPIYPAFMEGAYDVGNIVELVHPARFLFNAGATPKAWNRKMLDDPHFKVLAYEADSSKMFSNVDIKGGVAITLRNKEQSYGAIGIFTAYDELNSILKKVAHDAHFSPFSQIVITRTAYRLTDKMHEEHPEAISRLSQGHPYDMSTNIFDRLPDIFFDKRPDDGFEYIQILGRQNNQRISKHIRSEYVNQPGNLKKWKVIVPAANGSGALGEALSTPLIGRPLMGHTESFISIGSFDTEDESEAAIRYVKTKFTRCMLGVLKATQHNPPEKWAYVPLQDFTSDSDIDWTQSVADIDRQLYAKYGLDDDEISFIESHVKEMD